MDRSLFLVTGIPQYDLRTKLQQYYIIFINLINYNLIFLIKNL